jgi:PAS domain S-box-containing protein
VSTPTVNTDVASRQHTPWLPRRIALALALYALIGGMCSFLGWMLDIRRLTDWNNSGISIQPNAALCVALSGLSLLLLVSERRRAAAALGSTVLLLGGTTLMEWITGATLGIDGLFLFGREWGRAGVVWPGRMGPPGSLSWTLIGTALLLSASSARGRRLAPPLAIVTLALSVISITAHLYGASILYTMPRLTIIALQTATFIVAVSIGLIACYPDRQPLRLLLDRGTAGLLARRLLPLLIAVPFGLGMLRVLGQEAGLFDTAFGTTLRTVVELVIVFGLLWWSLSIVRRHEESQRKSVDRTNAMLGSITDAFFTLDPDWRFAFVNDEIARRFGLPRERIVGANIWEMLPGSEGNEAHIHLHRAMRDRVGVEYDVYYAPWQRWFHHKVYPAADGGLAVYSQDITERKHADTALRRGQDELDRQRRLYEAILGNTPDLAYVFDLNHRFTYANEVLLKMWGKTWDEAIGKNCLELGYEPWHAEMHDREIRQVIATRQPIRGEVPFSGAFGRRIYDYIFVPSSTPTARSRPSPERPAMSPNAKRPSAPSPSTHPSPKTPWPSAPASSSTPTSPSDAPRPWPHSAPSPAE